MRLRQSLYLQIVLLVSVVLATSVASYGWLVSKRQTQVHHAQFSREIEITARNMAELCAHHLTIEDYASMEHFLLRASDLPDIKRLLVCEPDGKLLADIVRQADGSAVPKYSSQRITPPAAIEPRHIVPAGQREGEYIVWQPISAGAVIGWLQVTVGTESLDLLRQAVWRSTSLMALAWIVAGILLLLVALKPSLDTIRQLANFARTLNARKGEEVTVRTRAREVSELADAINLASRELYASEVSLLSERERLAVIIGSIGDGVVACDAEGRVLLMNQAAERLAGGLNPAGQGLATLLPVDEGKRDEIDALIRGVMTSSRAGQLVEFEATFTVPGGEGHAVTGSITPLLDSSGQPQGTVTVLRDVTDKRRMEEEKHDLEVQLRQAQKMEAIGTLAGGIAHDFNNILTAILGYSELTKLDLEADSRPAQNLQQVLTACDRAKDLVKQILTFSRKSDEEQMPIQVHFLVKEALKLLRSSIPSTIEFRQSIDPSCSAVLANPTEIHQIMMNLCVNAFHAMREQGHGVLSVQLAPVFLEPKDVERMGLELASGNYLCLTVGDTGHGMAPGVLEKIFNPYFTTKKMGEGTGMGLAVVHGIVKRCGGHIKVYSEPGKGSTFSVYLPQFQGTAQSQDAADWDASLMPPGGSERILLVDDEASLVSMGQDLLASFGYQVESYLLSREALARFQRDPSSIDLVITDMTMPEMNGAELAKALLAIRPDLPIIVCSGYSQAISAQQLRDIGVRAFIQKPYPRRNMAISVRRVLDNQLLLQEGETATS